MSKVPFSLISHKLGLLIYKRKILPILYARYVTENEAICGPYPTHNIVTCTQK
jgi:hypothetical protein